MTLSPRELQIAALLQQGKTNKQIGQVLGLSQHTVRDNISPMFARFGVKNRAALVVVVSALTTTASQLASPSPMHAVERRAGVDRRAQPRA